MSEQNDWEWENRQELRRAIVMLEDVIDILDDIPLEHKVTCMSYLRQVVGNIEEEAE